MTKREQKLVRDAILSTHADWHACRLQKPERGIKAGTPCDDCISRTDQQMKELLDKTGDL